MPNITTGTYIIVSAHDPSLHLEMQYNNDVQVRAQRDVIAQRFEVESSGQYGEIPIFKITSQLTSSVLGIQRAGADNVLVGGYPRTRWEFNRRGNAYTIGLPNEDRVLALGPNNSVIFTERTGDKTQRWIITPFVEVDEEEDAARAEAGRAAEGHQRLFDLGVCLSGYQFIKQADGYGCMGDCHFVTNAELGI